MWSVTGMRRIPRAAIVWQSWSLASTVCSRPARRQFYKSRREMTNAWTPVSQVAVHVPKSRHPFGIPDVVSRQPGYGVDMGRHRHATVKDGSQAAHFRLRIYHRVASPNAGKVGPGQQLSRSQEQNLSLSPFKLRKFAAIQVRMSPRRPEFCAQHGLPPAVEVSQTGRG